MENNDCNTQVTQEYREAVTALADNQEDRRFLNDSRAHAKLLAELMIGRATEDTETCIYSGSLGKGCFAEALSSSEGTIRVLLDSKEGLDITNALDELVRNRLKVKIAELPHSNHFFISGNSFRYEKDHNDATAIANFNEPETVKKLKALFDSMWSAAVAA